MSGAVDEQFAGRRGPGRPVSTAPKQTDTFTASRMNPLAFMMDSMQSMPDPDEVFRKGLLRYADYFALSRDSHATSCISQRKSQPMTRAIRIQPAPNSAGGPLEEKALKLCGKMVQDWGQSFPLLISSYMDAEFYGMQPFELNWHWDSEVSGNVLERPRDLLQEWFAYTQDGHLRVKRPGSDFLTDPVPPFKVQMARNMPTTRNPYGQKLLSPCVWPITFKRGGMRFFAEYAEKFGMPTFLVRTTKDNAGGKLNAFVKSLLAMARRGVVSSTGEFEVSNLDMETKYQTTHLYDSFMDAMDKEVSKTLLGQTLTTDEGGSRAQGDIHKQILEGLWRMDDLFLSMQLTDLFDLVTFVNLGPGVRGPVAVVGEQLGLDRMERDKMLRDFHGIEFSDEYFQRHYDLRPGDYKRVDPLKASYKALPDSGTSPKDGGSRKSEAAKTSSESRKNHRNRGE